MEPWVPLFDIFLNSACPETEASQWLQLSFNPSSSTTTSAAAATTTTSSFLSLLTKPSNIIVVNSSSPSDSPPPTKRVMWIQTLPNTVQARILSFLALEHRRFSKRDLSRLVKDVLKDGKEIDFWVKKCARQLLDVLSESSYEWVSCLNLDSEEERVDDEFGLLPDWLKDAASSNESVLPWLPMSPDEFDLGMPFGSGSVVEYSSMEVVEKKEENLDKGETADNVVHLINDPIDPDIAKMAASLRSRILNYESSSLTVELASQIRKLCVESAADSLPVLGLIEPWKADDETASVLMSHLSNGSEEELGWVSHILCSIMLPKLLVLNEPASRVLVTATIEYCKLHQRACVYGLLFPLFLRMEGVNNPISDLIIRVLRECLHPAHVSAFCQKLLCGEQGRRNYVCLPCHKCLISDELVWTEPLFNLFQHILNHNVHITQDSVDRLVYQVQELAGRFSKSLKFGNFLLCLVTKCAPLLKSHKLSLTEAVQCTNTIVTKSILSKLANL
ncbi:hypothetical protein RJ640_021625 [Escallonia rubra]|uniref:Fanconi Anaemia group E protein C-terminal domain-containing protein n=1 Tax=Escallonia rubra TaxID=112253 RepID=A0AA88UT82_9ASTE|nr:hypothetical protein RJ640_021625 [Escallonia rubra]